MSSTIAGVKDTFSSWDSCMSKTYCKYVLNQQTYLRPTLTLNRWPVIVAIVIGSLILLSVLFCVARCIFCGVELCSCCVSCFTCCGCCKGGGRRRDRPSQFKDDYTRMPPTPYQGYQPAPSPMAYGGNPAAPQFATFDDPSSRRLLNEDSLPYMPSWDAAAKRRVEDTSAPPETKNGDLEMGRMRPQSQMRGAYNSVPNPALSPHPQQQPDYFHTDTSINHGYNNDLGDQRLLSHNEHDGFGSVPLSPPPTYRSNSSAPSLAGDQFIPGAASPNPHDYARSQQIRPQRQPSYQSSYAPSSTRYEPSHTDYTSDSRRISMPMPFNPSPAPQSHPPYSPAAASSYENRPPSFLTPGRKPVNGSTREV